MACSFSFALYQWSRSFGCTLESSRKLLKTLMSRLCPRPIKWEPLGTGDRHQYCLKRPHPTAGDSNRQSWLPWLPQYSMETKICFLPYITKPSWGGFGKCWQTESRKNHHFFLPFEEKKQTLAALLKKMWKCVYTRKMSRDKHLWNGKN